MSLIQCLDLHYTAGTKPIFSGLDFTLSAGEKVGLCGHNGCGKSSLLRLIAGQAQPDDGQVQKRRGLRLAYVEQFLPEALADATLLDAVAAVAPDGEAYRAPALLAQLRFRPEEHGFAVGRLSGGQQNRLMLARALMSEPELVLFDEPSNHLDIATLHMLQRFLREELRCAFVLVSHDRALLDAVTTRTLILRDGKGHAFDLPFSAAREALAHQDVAAAAARRAEEKEIEALRKSAKRLATWGKVYDNESFAKRAKSMEKRIERMEGERTFVSSGSGLKLELAAAETRAQRALRVAGVDILAPDGHTRLFGIDELVLRPGERVALLGVNGVGKSTFIRALVAQQRSRNEARAVEGNRGAALPPSLHLRDGARSGDSGIAFSPQAIVGYYDQELEELGTEGTLESYLRRHTDVGDAAIRAALIHAGFSYRDHDRRLAVLSGGERARLQFVRLRLSRCNFLILDEPTNHIDIDGKEELETQLIESGATLLVTAHDQRFIERVCDRFLWIDRGQLRRLESPAPFHDALFAAAAMPSTAAQPPQARLGSGGATAQAALTDDEEALLLRIVELEEKVADDLARKPKHQKPALRLQWERELQTLRARL